MNKMAVFVEGFTEIVFLDKLIYEIAGRNNVRVEWRQLRGGSASPHKNLVLKARPPGTGREHLVVVHDCGGDDAVKTRMIREYPNLVAAGYSRIVCLRDVYPTFTHADIPRLESSLPLYVKTHPIKVDFILSVMEVEAWFLAEHTHFARVDPALTPEVVREGLGFDPATTDTGLRPAPAADLDRCYQLVGKSYEKAGAATTVDALDCASIYLWPADTHPYPNRLCGIIEAFLLE